MNTTDHGHDRGSRCASTTRRGFLEFCRTGAVASLAGAGYLRAPAPHRRRRKSCPKHVTPETLRAVLKGLDYLAAQQAEDGSWISDPGGQAYPVAMTGLAGTALLAHGNSPTRGKYAKNVQGAVEYLVRCGTPTGLITGPGQDSGQPMHGHGFALMFLACVYGMTTKEALRRQVQIVVRKAVASDEPGPERGRRLDLYPRRRRRGLGHRHPGAGPACGPQRRFPRPPRRDRGGDQVPGEVPDARGRNPVLAALRRRPAAAHLGGRRGNPL